MTILTLHEGTQPLCCIPIMITTMQMSNVVGGKSDWPKELSRNTCSAAVGLGYTAVVDVLHETLSLSLLLYSFL